MHDSDPALNIMLVTAAIRPAVGIHNLRSELAAVTNFLLSFMYNDDKQSREIRYVNYLPELSDP